MTILQPIVWSYSGANPEHAGKQPLMSPALMLLIEAYRREYPFINLHHLGTVGDARHKKKSKASYHNHTPPDAIDITSIGEYDLKTDIAQRMIVAQRFASLGGVCFHAGNGKRGHLHVQTEGQYAGKYRMGEVNKK